MSSEKITEHVDEEKAIQLQNAWYKLKSNYKGTLDMIAFFFEEGYKEGGKANDGRAKP